MSDELELFGSEMSPVRSWETADVFGVQVLVAVLSDGRRLAELAPIAEWLGYSKAEKAAQVAGGDQVEKLNTAPARGSNRGNPNRLFASREGVNRLVNKSTKPEAVRLQRLWTDEVQIALEDHGTYSLSGVVPALPDFSKTDTQIQVLSQWLETLQANRTLEAKIAADAPLVEQALHHRSTKALTAIPDFANDLKAWAKSTGVDATIYHQDVFDFLAHLKLIIRGNTIRNNCPKADAIEAGYVKAHSHDWGSSARLTRKGYGHAWDRITPHIKATGSARPPAKPKGDAA